jgi:predicted nucleotidyltransferase
VRAAGIPRRSKAPDPVELAGVFASFPEVEAVYLFGSHAEGRGGRESDIDLGVVPGSPEARKRKLEILTALVHAGYDQVDLVFIGPENVTLRFEAVRPNRLIYAREGFDHGSYYSRALREYWDFLPILRIQREAFKRRLQGG